MSDDYASLLTTLIVTVLAVGTVQTYSLLKRWNDTHVEQLRVAMEARIRVADALGRGMQPSEGDLQGADQSARRAVVLARSWVAPWLAGGVWAYVVVMLGKQQLRILKWAATAGDPAAPELAKTSFYYVSIAVALLLAEGIVRVFVSSFIRQYQQLKPWRNYPRSSRELAYDAIRAYRLTGQPPAAPTSAGQSGP
ncbi:hypothetical protein GTY67_34275 [Streptomyces sp. SID8374]|uniref:hypothetical protein n=1 Tax=Streptomyces sp. SID8374 TaxID=2690354 RepID=UPI001367FAEF|nr:hypothetical protein [Streptomyces sp. SID8374]MYX18417.1 hypothetical protein [Streptomyces sp. SID8374]